MEKYQEQVCSILNNLLVHYKRLIPELKRLNEDSETISIDIYNKHENNMPQNIEDFRRNWLIGMKIEYFTFDIFLIGTRIKMCYELLALWKVDVDFSEEDKELLNKIMSEPQLNVQNVYDPIERRMVDIYPDRGNILAKRAEKVVTEEKIPMLTEVIINNLEANRRFEEEQKAAQQQEEEAPVFDINKNKEASENSKNKE